jgi:3',5'-cyclic AMP phosphodiesterase CpdA
MARLIQLTDIHFGGEDAPALEAALAYVRAARPDLVVLTGDITLNGTPKEFRAAQAFLQRLPKPWLSTPGNHDTPYWNLPLRALTPFRRYRRYIGPPHGGDYRSDALAVRMLNTARGAQPRPDWSKGAIGLQAVEASLEAFEAAPLGALRVLACHHPLVEAIDAPVTGGVHRGAAAAHRLAEGGVDLILTGHVHNPFAIPLPYGDEKTYAVGAGTLSLRLRGTPPSFNDILIEPGCVRVTAQGYVNGRYEPWRTWALPRR